MCRLPPLQFVQANRRRIWRTIYRGKRERSPRRIDVDIWVGQQAVHLLGRMLRVQTASGSEPVADRADRKGGAAQHAEGGIAERRDPLGVKVMAKHAAKNLPDLGLMENCCCLMTIAYPDLLLRGRRFVGSRDGKSGPGEFARICRRCRSCDSFRNRP